MTGKELLEKLKKYPEELLDNPIFIGFTSEEMNECSGTCWTIDHEDEVYHITTEIKKLDCPSKKKKKECIIIGNREYR